MAAAACRDGATPTAPRAPGQVPAGTVEVSSEPTEHRITPSNHLGASKLEIIPSVFPDNFNNVFPFGNNVLYVFAGFIYRNVPAFSLEVGDVIAFDLVGGNSVEIRRNVFFATANTNPEACVLSDIFVANPQNIAASSGWTKVVSETQVPQNAFGDGTLGNFELRYIAEAPFTFPGGGLLVGFQGSPPATFGDGTPDGIIAGARCTDPGGQLYARFLSLTDLPTVSLDTRTTTHFPDGVQIGGIVIFPAGGGGTGTCAEGVTEARAQIAQLLPDRPFLRFLLNFLLTRMQGGAPNAEGNFGALLDLLAQLQLISAQDATDLKDLVAPC